jgi:hypothetical protein
MCRYSDSLAALTVALNLMIDEGDTLLVAAIAHPLNLAAMRISREHDAVIANAVRSSPGGDGL